MRRDIRAFVPRLCMERTKKAPAAADAHLDATFAANQ